MNRTALNAAIVLLNDAKVQIDEAQKALVEGDAGRARDCVARMVGEARRADEEIVRADLPPAGAVV